MAYTTVNFKSKKAFKEAVAKGTRVGVWSPGPFPVPENGKVVIEGPQYPQPHQWYAQATVKDGVVTKVK